MDTEDAPPQKTYSSILRVISQSWKDYDNTRNIVAFFFLGLTNNFGYVIMLSAAHDLLKIIDDFKPHGSGAEYVRDCNAISTGAILLANIIPGTLIKFVAPFVPLMIHARMAVVVVATIMGLVLTALSLNKVCIIAGVCLVSLSQGLGETSLLAYTVFFKTKNVLSTWSSGTGLAGLLGSFAYSSLRQAGLSPKNTIYIMLCMPITMAICFWLVIERPMHRQLEQDHAEVRMLRRESERRENEEFQKKLILGKADAYEKPKSTLAKNISTIPKILYTYTLWYGLVYFFEYFINQGLFELVYIPNTFLDHGGQYRWYNTLYQLGVFVSRSSMNLVHINKTWITALLQGVNVVVFLMEAMYGYMTYLPIIFILILWEGLLGGACYVNTFRLIMTDWPQEGREFAMALNSIGDSVMVSMAGVVAIPVHDALCCTQPTYSRLLPENVNVSTPTHP